MCETTANLSASTGPDVEEGVLTLGLPRAERAVAAPDQVEKTGLSAALGEERRRGSPTRAPVTRAEPGCASGLPRQGRAR